MEIKKKQKILSKKNRRFFDSEVKTKLWTFILGRPFILELINPRKIAQTPEQIKELQARENASAEDIKIRDLQKITRLTKIYITLD